MRPHIARLPVIRRLRCLQFRRLRPLADGRQRGLPIVRYYWGEFLERHRGEIHGHALEIGGTETIRRYGGAALTRADGLDLAQHSPEITVVTDLTDANEVAAETYDCFVNQFTMHLIYDIESALFHSLRILKAGGTLLINFPSVEYCFARGLDMGTGAPLYVFWQFTPIHVENLLRRMSLTESEFELEVFGNLFARIAYQLNLPADELTRRELNYVDEGNPLLICVRVTKPRHWDAPTPERRIPWLPSVTPARWDPVLGHYAG